MLNAFPGEQRYVNVRQVSLSYNQMAENVGLDWYVTLSLPSPPFWIPCLDLLRLMTYSPMIAVNRQKIQLSKS